MHDAFEYSVILNLKKIELAIESIACYDDILLVGTVKGPIIKYNVKNQRVDGEFKCVVSLEKSNKSFSKKPIQQLCAVPELYLFICLTDNVVSAHDLTTLNPICTLSKTKGATLFVTDIQTSQSKNGKAQTVLRMCVAIRKKILTFVWNNNDFSDLYGELTMYDVPKAMTWYNDRLCIGFKKDYYIVKTESGDIKDLFPFGSKQTEPVITYMANEGFIVGRDNMSVFIDKDGCPKRKLPLTWTDIPLAIVYNAPYLISVLPKLVEIRTVEPQLMIQSLVLQDAKFMCHSSGLIYIASDTHVWRLNAMPIASQIRQLVQNKEFELALKLANMSDGPETEKQQRINTIETLYAVNLFCKHKFEESMNIFRNLNTDPSHVIGLYPNLLPAEFRKQLDYPEELPVLEGGDLEKGLLALIDYLNFKKRKMYKDNFLSSSAIKEGNLTVKSKEQLAQIIDTTLLKCYLQTNDALVASLLRLPDNKVHIEEAERALRKKKKFSELIILYERHGLHLKALTLLMEQAVRPNSSSLQGCDRTVQYLQHLGPDQLNLIVEFSKWVIDKNPEEGLKIFTEDLPEVESLPRHLVLNHLEELSKTSENQKIKDMPIQYLEHVIFVWKDVSEDLHNRFAELLRIKVQMYLKEHAQTLPEGHILRGAKMKSNVYRQKLVDFLQTSEIYKPEELLPRFPMNDFFEERAVLLGRLGRHEVALGLYIIILKDTQLAESYCKKYYSKKNTGREDVYFYLLKVYLQPPDPSSLGLSALEYGSKPEPNIPEALRIMTEYAAYIDTTKVLELLPPDIKISEILAYLENVLELKAATKNKNKILKNILFSESMIVHQQKMFYEKEAIVINDLKSCVVCKKRIGNSFFARYPNGVIVHYGCCKDFEIAPVSRD